MYNKIFIYGSYNILNLCIYCNLAKFHVIRVHSFEFNLVHSAAYEVYATRIISHYMVIQLLLYQLVHLMAIDNVSKASTHNYINYNSGINNAGRI